MSKDYNGANNPSWKGGVISHGDGYVRRLDRSHPRADVTTGYVLEHIVVAEKALGHPLPPRAEVHHMDENKSNNAGSNLVICPDREYHMLLHARLRIRQAGGNPNTEKICSLCRRLLPFERFTVDRHHHGGLGHRCRDCRSNLNKTLLASDKDNVNAERRRQYAARMLRRKDVQWGQPRK